MIEEFAEAGRGGFCLLKGQPIIIVNLQRDFKGKVQDFIGGSETS